MPTMHEPSASERVLDEAERLFMQHGYAAVTLRDIADALGIRVASLYYHAPGGKEELYLRVVERSIARHHEGIRAAIEGAAGAVEPQLRAVADWFLSNPPMHAGRIVSTDLRALGDEHVGRLSGRIFTQIMLPIAGVFQAGAERGEVAAARPVALAGSVLSILEAIVALDEQKLGAESPTEVAYYMIGVLLNGLRR